MMIPHGDEGETSPSSGNNLTWADPPSGMITLARLRYQALSSLIDSWELELEASPDAKLPEGDPESPQVLVLVPDGELFVLRIPEIEDHNDDTEEFSCEEGGVTTLPANDRRFSWIPKL